MTECTGALISGPYESSFRREERLSRAVEYLPAFPVIFPVSEWISGRKPENLDVKNLCCSPVGDLIPPLKDIATWDRTQALARFNSVCDLTEGKAGSVLKAFSGLLPEPVFDYDQVNIIIKKYKNCLVAFDGQSEPDCVHVKVTLRLLAYDRQVPDGLRQNAGKLRQVVSQKFGYGIKENKAFKVAITTMNTGDLRRILGNGALYHIKRIYRELFTLGETVTVKVSEGRLRGRKLTSVLGKPYFRFQGIPYAKPPIGPLRFKDPEPPEPWSGVRNALKEGDICVQVDVITGIPRGNEDCLYLNIFTPQLPQSGVEMEKKAVMVWIHGGGFQMGSGNAEVYGPDFFLDDDVILVTLNYRLGIMGFLSTGTDDAPGNAGLKDIVQALKWINKNIAVFGGDPNKVTIFGESAGGAAVQYMMMSPLAKGLFSSAISQSGSALCPWALNEDEPREVAFRLGRAFGLETKDPKVLVDFLRKISAAVLAKKQSTAVSERNKRECLPFPFLPCIEPSSPRAFLPDHPLKIIEGNKLVNDVPYITGINEMEGVILLKSIIDKFPPVQTIDKDFERLVPRFLNLEYGSPESKEVAKKIREYYFKNQVFDASTYREYTDLITDTYFHYGMHVTTKIHAQLYKAPVWNYHFLFEGDFGLLKKILNVKSITGPVHADDLGYLFHIPVIGPNVDPKTREMKFSKKMVRLWTNFAKYRNPTPDPTDPVLRNLMWKPYAEEQQPCLLMADEFSMGGRINEERMKFWTEMKANY
ncbi:hypothetical protein RUM43_008903 [Polyplax serrata]|uniref:Carboxylesterase type B domain-containing protein n=1 Tax=Polyplax serrata TaxID=468196 RepID=A0AAN8NP97_POLSC